MKALERKFETIANKSFEIDGVGMFGLNRSIRFIIPKNAKELQLVFYKDRAKNKLMMSSTFKISAKEA